MPFLSSTGSLASSGVRPRRSRYDRRDWRVNGVSPGVIDTRWRNAFPVDERQAAFADSASKTSVGRIGRPEGVAQAIAFVIKKTFIDGHTLICDGDLRLTV
ncbi:MAG: SDR family oxidoreductase [Bradyrhizobium sp.]|uniref:SDR family oxidoreductase n=1 Tax=Bradyrhizobium sp. TaxID=376 RepID=UPI0029A89A68|nr:SDR family oxidoreductase [Bradyrhizobium sp.]MDX3971750.1 SDR family oxidoreductase [Bradyrhizobium sp.]